MSNPTVPLLDLAPKRTKPLSLWNPLDYLLLLYWVLFFPQALRWYVEKFGTVEYKRENHNWREDLQILRTDPIQRNLWIQGLLLIPLVAFGINWILPDGEASRNWSSWARGAGALGIAELAGIRVGLGMDVAGGVAYRSVAYKLALFSVMGGLTLGMLGGLAKGMAVGVAFGVAFSVVECVAITRLPDFLLAAALAFFERLNARHCYPVFSRTTWLPLPGLRGWLLAGLQAEPIAGLVNVNEILHYSLQFIPAVQAVNDWLARQPDELMCRQVDRLAGDIFDWKLIV